MFSPCFHSLFCKHFYNIIQKSQIYTKVRLHKLYTQVIKLLNYKKQDMTTRSPQKAQNTTSNVFLKSDQLHNTAINLLWLLTAYTYLCLFLNFKKWPESYVWSSISSFCYSTWCYCMLLNFHCLCIPWYEYIVIIYPFYHQWIFEMFPVFD